MRAEFLRRPGPGCHSGRSPPPLKRWMASHCWMLIPAPVPNRTVVTFVGNPEAAVEAAFRGIQKAAELIDMRKQKGAHPRMGATDVCPFIPVSNVSWEEAIACAKSLGKRVAEPAKNPRLSLRESGTRCGAVESLCHSRRRIRRILREDQTARLEARFRSSSASMKAPARP